MRSKRSDITNNNNLQSSVIGFLHYFLNLLKNNIEIGVASIIGFAWISWIPTFGIGFSPDAGYYLNYALNMHYANNYYVQPVWPPAYPILINIGMFFTDFPAEAAALVSGLSIFGTLILFAVLLKTYSNNRIFNLLLLLIIGSFSSYAFIHTIAFSEAPFVFFIFTNIVFTLLHLKSKKPLYFLLASIATSMAVLTRYAGVTLVGVFFIYTIYILIQRNKEEGISLGRYILYHSISYLPVMLYFLINRDYFLARLNSSQEIQSAYETTLFRPIIAIFQSIQTDLNIYLILFIIISIGIFLWQINAKNYLFSVISQTYILGFVGVYLAFIILISIRIDIFPIDTRFFAPIYLALLLFAIISWADYFSLSNTEQRQNDPIRKYGLVFLYSILSLTMLSNIISFSEAMNNLSIQKFSGRGLHQTAGYDLTQTPKKISAYLKEILQKDDHVHLGMLFYFPTGTQRSQLSGTMLYRKNIIPSEATLIGYEDVDRFDFTVHLKLDGHDKYLQYQEIGSWNNNSMLAARLLQIMEQEEISELLLIVWEGDEDFGAVISSYLDPQLDIIEKRVLRPYKAYWLLKNNNSN